MLEPCFDIGLSNSSNTILGKEETLDPSSSQTWSEEFKKEVSKKPIPHVTYGPRKVRVRIWIVIDEIK